MNLKEALEYIKENPISDESEICLVGLTFNELEFFALRLNYDADDVWFTAILEGGPVVSAMGTEDAYSGDTIEEMMEEIPSEYHNLNYELKEIDSDLFSHSSEYFLNALFPELFKFSDEEFPTKAEVNRFISEAKQLIQAKSVG